MLGVCVNNYNLRYDMNHKRLETCKYLCESYVWGVVTLRRVSSEVVRAKWEDSP